MMHQLAKCQVGGRAIDGQEEGAREQDAQGFKSGLASTPAFGFSVPGTGSKSSPSSLPLFPLLEPNQVKYPSTFPLRSRSEEEPIQRRC